MIMHNKAEYDYSPFEDNTDWYCINLKIIYKKSFNGTNNINNINIIYYILYINKKLIIFNIFIIINQF